MRAVLLFALAAVLLLTTAAAASASTVSGEPINAKKLAHTVTLPNGQKSRYTFTLSRDSDDANVTGYAVASTRYYESLNLDDYRQVTRATAFAAYNDDFVLDGKFVFKRLRADGVTYNVLKRVYYDILGE